MFGFLGKLFGSDNALASVVDSVSSGLDKLYYSDEEKAEDAARDRSEARKMVVNWLQATQGQNLARRLIALSITAVWLGMFVCGVFCNMIGVFWLERAEQLSRVADISKLAADDMTSPVMLILSFYFAAPYMGDIAKKFLNKKGQK